jgi:hypothetical protein
MGWIDSLPPKFADNSINWPVTLYMVSYVIVANWTLLQVSNQPASLHCQSRPSLDDANAAA